MEMKIISKEIIKPSSSSADIKSFKLSVLDQLSPLTYTSLIFFYSPNNKLNHSTLTQQLKTSLSQTLTKFHLLAATIQHNKIICNNQGALFLESTLTGALPDLLGQPQSDSLTQLLPSRSISTESPELHPQVAVQLNRFNCGGVALAVCFLHKIIDGTTLSSFMKSWAEITSGFSGEECGFSDYAAVSELFPAREVLDSDSWLSKENSPFVLCRGKNCIRRFVFDEAAILDLKGKGKSESVVKPTSVEVITAFIWKYAIEAARERSGSRRPSVLTHAVNLRRRMSPPLPATSTGNIFWSALSYYNSPNSEIEIYELVKLLRSSFEEIDSNFIHKMTKKEGFKAISNSLLQIQELYLKKPDAYGFTSWKNMGLNEVDFGWGKPLWVSFAGLANSRLKNIVIMKETVVGEGIEVWVILDEEEMKLLENNQDFLAFASLNPSIYLA